MAGSVMVPYNWRFLVLEKLGERYKKLIGVLGPMSLR